MIKLSVNIDSYYNEIYNLVSEFFPLEKINKDTENEKTIELNFIINENNQNIVLNYIIENIEKDIIKSFKYQNNFNLETKKHKNNSIKKCIVDLLLELNPAILPWGILTGVRPVKIVHNLIDSGITDDVEIYNRLNDLRISDDNIKTLIKIAYRQRNLVYPLNIRRISVYIHIPFCPTKCSYCSYNTMIPNKNRDKINIYLDALELEINGIKEILSNFIIDSIYIGGGTPTVLTETEFSRLLSIINKNLSIDNLREFTVEAGRPDTISKNKLKILKEFGVNRISINPQTMNENTLKKINRLHSVESIYTAFDIAREVNFKTINTDLILGLEDENSTDLLNTLNKINKLNPENITIHTLSIKKGSKYIDSYVENESKNIYEMMNLSKDFCRENFYEPYYLYRQKNILGNLENTGYSKLGHESIYNIAMMEERQTILSFGMGAVSKYFFPEEDRHERISNFNDFNLYISNIDSIIKNKSENLNSLLGG